MGNGPLQGVLGKQPGQSARPPKKIWPGPRMQGGVVQFTAKYDNWISKTTTKVFKVDSGSRTCQAIAARLGVPSAAHEIAKLNHIHSTRQKLRIGRHIRVPGTYFPDPDEGFRVWAQDGIAPTVTDAYANFQVITVPGQKGLSQFLGYDPVALDIAVTFEAYREGTVPPLPDLANTGHNQWAGQEIEQAISVLERFGGRGKFKGATNGPPPVLQISTADKFGNAIPLIPKNYQSGVNGPFWRVANIQWNNTPLRDQWGQRIRQDCVITVWEYTPVKGTVSAATRAAVAAAYSTGTGGGLG